MGATYIKLIGLDSGDMKDMEDRFGNYDIFIDSLEALSITEFNPILNQKKEEFKLPTALYKQMRQFLFILNKEKKIFPTFHK